MRQRDLVRFWLPLYASWLLMMSEGPLVSAAVNRLPDEVAMLAALGIVLGLAIFIESPIINLLATATALVRDRAAFRLVRRFTLHWMIALAAVSAVVVVPAVFDLVVRDLLGAPPNVARWVRPGLVVMIPWAPAIAWRRFLQGLLIRAQRPRPIAVGTAFRLAMSAGCAFAMAAWGQWPGVLVGAVALMVGVVAEALYTTLVARPVVRALPATTDGEPLTYRSLLAYHLPLASTSVLTLIIHPAVTVALARLDRPTISLAAWPLVFQLTLLVRSAAFALPEMVIALETGPAAGRALRRFSLLLAAATLTAMLVLTVTPAAELYLRVLQSATVEVADLTRLGALVLIPTPPLVVLTCWLRGGLMRRRRTARINRAMLVRIVVFTVALVAGLWLGGAGIVTAAWAINLSVAAELAVLALGVRQHGRATDL